MARLYSAAYRGLMSTPRRAFSALVAAFACAVMLGGCFLQVDDRGATSAAREREGTQEIAIHELFGWYRVNWNPPASTVELAHQSELVVSGTVGSVHDGRVEGYDTNSQGSPRTLVLDLAHPTFSQGSLPKRADGHIYIEIPPTHAVYGFGLSQAIPIGTRVVAYLTLANNGSGLTRISNWNDGRPAGKPLYQPVNPAGLLIQLDGLDRFSWLLDPHPSVVASTPQVLPGGSVVLRPFSIRAGVAVG